MISNHEMLKHKALICKLGMILLAVDIEQDKWFPSKDGICFTIFNFKAFFKDKIQGYFQNLLELPFYLV